MNHLKTETTNTIGESRNSFSLARYALDAPVLPLVTDTLLVAEAVRTAVMGRYQRLLHQRKFGHANKPYQEQFRSRTLAGKDEAGQPLRDQGHARYLPVDEDGDGRLDHLVVFAESGFDADEVAALDRLRSLRVGETELRLLLVGLGRPVDFRGPLFGPAAVWESATPFVVTRYPKRRGTKRDRPEHYATMADFARHVLSQELNRLRQRRPDLPPVAAIELLDGIGPRRLRPTQFQRLRNKPDDDGGRRPAGGFRICFAQPTQGPFGLGHSAHFGLGMFLAKAKD